MITKLSILAILLTSSLTTSCKTDTRLPADAGSEQATTDAAPTNTVQTPIDDEVETARTVRAGSRPDKDVLLGAKLNSYILCLNRYTSHIRAGRKRYYSWVKDAKTGPTGKEQNPILGAQSLYNPADCVRSIRKAKNKQPSMPDLEAAGDAFATTIVTLLSVLEQAVPYYEKKDFKTDAFAKGKQLHKKLVTAWDEWDTANAALRKIVSAENSALQLRKLERLQKEGKTGQYLGGLLVHQARQLVNTTSSEDFELTQFREKLTAYEETLEAMNAWYETNKDTFNALDRGSSIETYLQTHRHFLTPLRELVRTLQDNQKAKNADNIRAKKVEELVNKFNDLVIGTSKVIWPQ